MLSVSVGASIRPVCVAERLNFLGRILMHTEAIDNLRGEPVEFRQLASEPIDDLGLDIAPVHVDAASDLASVTQYPRKCWIADHPSALLVESDSSGGSRT